MNIKTWKPVDKLKQGDEITVDGCKAVFVGFIGAGERAVVQIKSPGVIVVNKADIQQLVVKLT